MMTATFTTPEIVARVDRSPCSLDIVELFSRGGLRAIHRRRTEQNES